MMLNKSEGVVPTRYLGLFRFHECETDVGGERRIQTYGRVFPGQAALRLPISEIRTEIVLRRGRLFIFALV